MVTDEEMTTVYEILSRIDTADLFTFDTRYLSTAIDGYTAYCLIWLAKYNIKILEAIVDLYAVDITGCIDSELL